MTSDHFDGRRFFNPNGAVAGQPLWQMLRWKFTARRGPWPERVVNEAVPPPPERVGPGQLAATFVGHSTWLLRFESVVLLTDPIWSDVAGPFNRLGPRRVRPAALPFERLPKVDVVLVSHSHYDHMDIPTLRRLDAAFRPQFVTTLGNRRYLQGRGLRDVNELDWWQSCTVGGVDITLTPAQHFAARTPFDKNRTLWGGFHLRTSPSVYFAADTGYDGAIFRAIREQLGPPDVAFIPIGAYEPRWFMRATHMDPDESVRAFQDVGARSAAGMHFGVFRLTDEAYDEPPQRFRVALAAADIPPERFVVPGFGQTLLFPR